MNNWVVRGYSGITTASPVQELHMGWTTIIRFRAEIWALVFTTVQTGTWDSLSLLSGGCHKFFPLD
jgi:hypothetical protein